ncbi:hypothetical protein [Streptomyces sp. NPDC002746]
MSHGRGRGFQFVDAARPGAGCSGRVGREVRYSVRPAALDAPARWMAGPAADRDGRPAHVKRVAEAAERDAY